MWNQWNAVNVAFTARIAETTEARDHLQHHLSRVLQVRITVPQVWRARAAWRFSLGTSLRTCFLHNNVVRFYWGSYERTSPIPVSLTLCCRKSLTWRKTSRCWRKPSRIKPTRCRFDQLVSFKQVFLLFCFYIAYLSVCVLSAGVSNEIGDQTEAT